VHDSKRVTSLDNLNNGLYQPRRLSLTVVALLDDPVEELATLAELHHEVHGGRVLVRTLDANHVGVLRQVVHYLNLPPHVLVILLAQKLPLRNRLARELSPSRPVRAQERRPELPLPQFPTHLVHLPDVLRPVRQNPRCFHRHVCRTRTRFRRHCSLSGHPKNKPLK